MANCRLGLTTLAIDIVLMSADNITHLALRELKGSDKTSTVALREQFYSFKVDYVLPSSSINTRLGASFAEHARQFSASASPKSLLLFLPLAHRAGDLAEGDI